MTNEEKQIAIARACGWTDIRTPSDGSYYQIDMETLGWLMGRVAGVKPGERVHKILPDYPSDRDAMIEAIKTLPPLRYTRKKARKIRRLRQLNKGKTYLVVVYLVTFP